MGDPCCPLCRSVPGTCLTRWQCDHHKAAQAQEDADHEARRTIRDPTAKAAIRNVMRERKKK